MITLVPSSRIWCRVVRRYPDVSGQYENSLLPPDGFLVGSLYVTEDNGSRFLRIVDPLRTTRAYSPEDRDIQCRKNLEPNVTLSSFSAAH
jgi:hypothetical protein